MSYERSSTKATTQVYFESINSVLFHRNQANICNSNQTMLCATIEINFEFSWQILAYRISEKESCNCFSIRSRIKLFVRTDTSKVATHNIPDRIATSLSCC